MIQDNNCPKHLNDFEAEFPTLKVALSFAHLSINISAFGCFLVVWFFFNQDKESKTFQ